MATTGDIISNNEHLEPGSLEQRLADMAINGASGVEQTSGAPTDISDRTESYVVNGEVHADQATATDAALANVHAIHEASGTPDDPAALAEAAAADFLGNHNKAA